MQNQQPTQGKKKYWMIGGIVFAILLLVVLTVANYDAVESGVFFFLGLLRAVIIGLALSYLCNPFFRFFEQKVFTFVRYQGLRRTLSLILTYLLMILIIAALLLLVVPGLVKSIHSFIDNYEAHLTSALNQCNGIIDRLNALIGKVIDNQAFFGKLDYDKLTGFFAGMLKDTEGLKDFFSNANIAAIIAGVGGVFSLITDSILGIFVSVYLLMDKEKRHGQVMKLRTALFSERTNNTITRICRTADRCFGRFIRGKLLDSIIVGLLVYIALLIADVPYAILLASIIAVCNIIPIIGPLIGAVPCGVIILLTAPAKLWIFVLIALVIQQIDSNIIAPKIIGSNIGVSSLCVMIAFTTMSVLWGFWGAILGVPLFATALELLDHYTINRLKNKGLPSEVDSYYAQGSVMDPADDAKTSTRRLQRKLEARVLAAETTVLEKGEDALSRKERFYLRIYRWAKKARLADIITDETYLDATVARAYKEAGETVPAYDNPVNTDNTQECEKGDS